MRLPLWSRLKELHLLRNPIDVMIVENTSVGLQTLLGIRGHIQEKNPSSVLFVAKASARNLY